MLLGALTNPLLVAPMVAAASNGPEEQTGLRLVLSPELHLLQDFNQGQFSDWQNSGSGLRSYMWQNTGLLKAHPAWFAQERSDDLLFKSAFGLAAAGLTLTALAGLHSWQLAAAVGTFLLFGGWLTMGMLLTSDSELHTVGRFQIVDDLTQSGELNRGRRFLENMNVRDLYQVARSSDLSHMRQNAITALRRLVSEWGNWRAVFALARLEQDNIISSTSPNRLATINESRPLIHNALRAEDVAARAAAYMLAQRNARFKADYDLALQQAKRPYGI